MHAWDPAARAPALGVVPVPALPPPTPRATEPHVPPSDSPVLSLLRRVHDRHRLDASGAVATYIPELARADPAWFGIVVATRRRRRLRGRRHARSRSRSSRSPSRSPTGWSSTTSARPPSGARIGVEPTGDAFNAISLGAGTGMPLNPMVNAGAITAVGLMPETAVGGADLARRARSWRRSAASPAATSTSTSPSTSRSGTPATATGRSRTCSAASGPSPTTPTRAVDAYFRAVLGRRSTARDLALVAATLANGGANPLTGELAASDADRPRHAAQRHGDLRHVRRRGRVDVRGRPAGQERRVGRDLRRAAGPARDRRLVAAARRRAGTASAASPSAATSPASSTCTSSGGARPPSPVRTRGSVASLPSKRSTRRPRARADLERRRALARHRAPGEPRLRRRGDARAGGAPVRRGGRCRRRRPAPRPVDRSRRRRSARRPRRRARRPRRRGRLERRPGRTARCSRRVDDALSERRLAPPRRFAELDLALEWAEDVVLSRFKGPGKDARPTRLHVPLEEHPAFAGLTTPVVDCLKAVMERRQFHAGDALVRHGEPARRAVRHHRRQALGVGAGGRRRHAAGSRRSTRGSSSASSRSSAASAGTADVYCDTEVEAWVLTTDAFDELDARRTRDDHGVPRDPAPDRVGASPAG